MIAAKWKIFTKAGKPGWASIVPIYDIVVLMEIINKPLWWVVLILIPFVNIIIGVIILIELAKVFGKSSGFGVAMLFFPYVCMPILAFGDATYQGGDESGELLDN